MQQFSSQRQPDGGSPRSSPPSSPPSSPAAPAASSKQAAAAGCREVHVSAGSPKQPQSPFAAASVASAAQPGGSGGGCCGGSGAASPRTREHRHTTEHADEAYRLPEHAQAAALLGQPVYDLGLSAPLAAVPAEPVPSSATPHRSPFMSELLHHSHPPGPQELLQRGGSTGPATRASSEPLPSPGSPASGLADALAQLQGLSPASVGSSAAHWLSDDEEEGACRQQRGADGGCKASGGGRGGGGGACGTPAAVYRALPFSVRNAPLLRMIPKYCEWALPHAHARLRADGATEGLPCVAARCGRPGARRACCPPLSCADSLPLTAALRHPVQTACGSWGAARAPTTARCLSWRTWRERTATPASWTSRRASRGAVSAACRVTALPLLHHGHRGAASRCGAAAVADCRLHTRHDTLSVVRRLGSAPGTRRPTPPTSSAAGGEGLGQLQRAPCVLAP